MKSLQLMKKRFLDFISKSEFKNFFEALNYEYGINNYPQDLQKAFDLYKTAADSTTDTLSMYRLYHIYKKDFKKFTIYKIAGIGAIILGLSVILFGQTILKSYQVSRILNYKNPCQRYTEETGYQVCNGYIAINNGGLLGVGLGNSTQKYLYLPEAHTDFIFPIICEAMLIKLPLFSKALQSHINCQRKKNELQIIEGSFCILYGTNSFFNLAVRQL